MPQTPQTRIKTKARSDRKAMVKPKLPRLPNPGCLAEIYAELMTRPNVEGCFIGKKRTNGRATGRLSVICAVREKVGLKDLDPDKERLPGDVQWVRGKARTGRLPTDVQVLSDRFRPAAGPVAGPGDEITIASGDHATLGIALAHPIFGNVVTTAGHLLLAGAGTIVFPHGQRPSVQLIGPPTPGFTTGVALKAVRSATADYALVRPDSIPVQNLYGDQTPIANPFLPSDQDIGATLLVLGARGVRNTTFKGVHGLLPVGAGGLMENLLVTDFSTESGDSGCCLVDLGSRVWGLLVGFSELDGLPCSVFMSAALPAALEGAVFL